MGKKRDMSIFDAIEELETQDRRADGKRQKRSQTDHQRAKEVETQTKIYNNLVEVRILMQRAKGATANVSATSVSATFRDTCNNVLEKLLLARSQLAGETDTPEDKYKDMLSSSSSKELHKMLKDEHEGHKEQWKTIFNQRHKSLKLHSGVTAKSQFRVMDSSFWEQVESTVEYEEIRERNSADSAYATKVFDDSKVYQQLLKDFVTSSTSTAGTSSAAVAAHRLKAAQQKKNSDKKNVDRRASKGRKIRYKEISKLVNFTFPLSRPSVSNLNQDEYFHSLFGGAGKSKN
ncbi:MAG: hypothetical protein SGILL_000428 [Bacillariaceae sp.]